MFELGCAPGDFVEHHAEQEPMPGRKPTQAHDRHARGGGRPQAPPSGKAPDPNLDLASDRPDRGSPRGQRDRGRRDSSSALARLSAVVIFRAMPKYTLPELAYDYGALEPHVSGKIMQLHHDKHHAAYVAGANTAADGLAEARAKNDFAKIATLEKALAFHTSGHVLHSLFWQNLAPKAGGEPTGALGAQIKQDFGGFAGFKGQLTNAAMTIMGSGWAALAWEPVAKRLRDHADLRPPDRTSTRAASRSSCSTPGSTPFTCSTGPTRRASSRRSGTSGTGRTSSSASRRSAALDLGCAAPPTRNRDRTIATIEQLTCAGASRGSGQHLRCGCPRRTARSTIGMNGVCTATDARRQLTPGSPAFQRRPAASRPGAFFCWAGADGDKMRGCDGSPSSPVCWGADC